MKSVILREFGDISNFKVVDLIVPKCEENDLLVKLKAISINPIDFKTRRGKGVAANFELPAILGWDISGEIVEVGKNVSNFKIGDEVFGLSNFPKPANAYAEYTICNSAHMALKPKEMSHHEAAAACCAGLTAYQFLHHHAKIQKGQKILIHAAAGGVGHFAVQLAKLSGLQVYATASSKNETFLKELGVDVFIDYTVNDFRNEAKDMDIVFDGVGGEVSLQSLECIRNNGMLITLPSMYRNDSAVLENAKNKNITCIWPTAIPNVEDLNELATLIISGKIKVKISKVFLLEEIALAHAELEKGHTQGKIIISVV